MTGGGVGPLGESMTDGGSIGASYKSDCGPSSLHRRKRRGGRSEKRGRKGGREREGNKKEGKIGGEEQG